MIDGLYIANRWVADVPLALTLQANVLTDPSALHSSYSNTAGLPDSLDIRALTGNAEQIDSAGDDPYRLLPASAVWQGAVVFSGVATLKQFNAGWSVELSENKTTLFDQLASKSLRDLDLVRYNHKWNLSNIQSLNAESDAVVYPFIDYGTVAGDIVPSDTMFPAVRVKTLLAQMLDESGYTPVGDWLTDPLLDRLAIPFVEEAPTAVDQDWIDARTARVTLTAAPEIVISNTDLLHKFKTLNRIQPYDRDSPVTEGLGNGKQQNFKTDTATYIADTAMRLRVQAYQQFKAKVTSGAPEVKLIVEVNGSNVEQAYWSKSGPYNTINALSKLDEVRLDTTINLKAGDSVRVRLVVEKRTTFGVMEVTVYNTSATSFASFIPDATIQYGDTWLVARNLPDLKCLDLMKTVALICSATWDVDFKRRQVRLIPLNETVALTPDDWSGRVTDAEPTYTPTVEPYAQKNLLKWKETDGVDKGYGDGVINCNAPSLKAEETLFELPFAASMPSPVNVGGYGNPLRIETRTVATSGDTVTITKKSTTPRLILIEPHVIVNVKTKIAGTTPGSIVDSTCALLGCWFAIRPLRLASENNAFSLAFDPVAGQFVEQSLISRYFDGLKHILRRPRTLTVLMYLRPADVADLQTPDSTGTIGLMRPVRLRNVTIGSLRISQSEFLINKIPDIQDGIPSQVTLIAY